MSLTKSLYLMSRFDAVNQHLNCDVMVFSIQNFISYLIMACLLRLKMMVTSVYKELKNLSKNRDKFHLLSNKAVM